MKILIRLILLAVGCLFGVMAAEVAFRVIDPTKQQMTFAAGTLDSFVEDPECGYLPRLATPTQGSEYSAYGCVNNDYDANDRKGRQRILFVGDSVTHRARIISALRKLYGEKDFEYWNAGVESFNTQQELVLYRRHNHKLKPDQVVLTFHINDFQSTPVVFRKNGQLKILMPEQEGLNPWLFEHSFVYRWVTHQLVDYTDLSKKEPKVESQMAELKSLVEQQGGRLSVLLLPSIQPLATWNTMDLAARKSQLAISQRLKLRSFDLLDSTEKALAQGIVGQETPGDAWHPSDALAQKYAEFLKQQKLLEPHSPK